MDYFNLVMKDGTEKKMEIVCIFKIGDSSYNYIIYNELDKSRYYIAKYMGNEIVDLSTDLSEEEYAYANKIFKGVVGK